MFSSSANTSSNLRCSTSLSEDEEEDIEIDLSQALSSNDEAGDVKEDSDVESIAIEHAGDVVAENTGFSTPAAATSNPTKHSSKHNVRDATKQEQQAEEERRGLNREQETAAASAPVTHAPESLRGRRAGSTPRLYGGLKMGEEKGASFSVERGKAAGAGDWDRRVRQEQRSVQ